LLYAAREVPHFRLSTFLIAGLLTLGGCFVGYDSNWGHAKAVQKQVAAQSTPNAIGATTDDAHPRAPERTTYRLRFRPNGHYLAQTVDAQRQLEDMVRDANDVLEPSLGLHLEIEATQPWSSDADDTLKRALEALRRDDPGDGAEVVVGLIGALPRPTESLHEVGYAEVLGKYVILRAPSRLGEHDAVDRALSDLSDEERDRVVRARRRHRAEAVFLHELGHTLGAPHEADFTSLMHPAYDEKMSSFSADGVALMRLALEGTDRRAIAEAQFAYLRDTKDAPWTSDERDAAMARLQPWMGQAATADPAARGQPAAAVDATAPADPTPVELRQPDRAIYLQAMQSFRAGHAAEAYSLARPLFGAYPQSYAVQDLRCQLATVRWLEKDAMVAECAAAVRLADGGVR
jgi:hypothetical protein